MKPANIPGLIKKCPDWHLLKRADEVNKVIAHLALEIPNKNGILCAAGIAENVIFSALNANYHPGTASEDNRFDLWCLLSYLHDLGKGSGIEAARWTEAEAWYLDQLLRILLSLHCQRNLAPGTTDYDLLKFLGGLVDFLQAQVHSRRTNG